MQYRQAKTGKLLIEIIPNKCDFCGCCVGVCPEDAIELKEAIDTLNNHGPTDFLEHCLVIASHTNLAHKKAKPVAYGSNPVAGQFLAFYSHCYS